ncbi:carboxylesterase [Mycena crocata]|nr:carboxylesterase [Mycena crocata]
MSRDPQSPRKRERNNGKYTTMKRHGDSETPAADASKMRDSRIFFSLTECTNIGGINICNLGSLGCGLVSAQLTGTQTELESAGIPGHLHDELLTSARIQVETEHGKLTGGRAANGTAVFLEVPYALPPARFQDPKPLPPDFRYVDKEYTREETYAAQPRNDGQIRGDFDWSPHFVSLATSVLRSILDMPFEDKVGYGKPSENALFLNIVSPRSFPTTKGFPVRVFLHGGFLQFGSPHGLGSQAQYIAAERLEVWVNIGYRLSAFGFLACDQPPISGNFGFKDQWLALEWIHQNIEAFGGSHSVHQLLHRASHLPDGVQAPLHSAVLQSNAIVCAPKTPQELRPQFEALCRALKIDPTSHDALQLLSEVPASEITEAIETDALGTEYGTFRGCTNSDWLPTSPNLMAWQRTGDFADNLRKKGIKSIMVGYLIAEWYLYSIPHPIESPKDVVPNLERYYTKEMVTKLLEQYAELPEDATGEESQRLFGEVLRLIIERQPGLLIPGRILVRDLHEAGFPVLRYDIRWAPERFRSGGYATHGSDRSLWAFRVPDLTADQIDTARNWLTQVFEWLDAIERAGKPVGGPLNILVLTEDRDVRWKEDLLWDEKMRLLDALPEFELE